MTGKYRVNVEVVGDFPNNDDTYDTLREAQDGAMYWATMFRADGFTVKGNKRDGYTAYAPEAVYSIYVTLNGDYGKED